MEREAQVGVVKGLVHTFRGHRLVLLAVAGVFAWSVVGAVFFRNDLEAYAANLWTEAVGILIPVLIIDRLYRRLEAKRDKAAEMDRLKSELASGANVVAFRAAEQLRQNEALLDGSLTGLSIQGAALAGTNLRNAQLDKTNLSWANLSKANLFEASLQGTNLYGGDITEADFWYANLAGAILSSAIGSRASFAHANCQRMTATFAQFVHCQFTSCNLRDADLRSSNLRGAILTRADLRGAKLSAVEMDETTILPDNSTFREGETDLSRFTNPTHEMFWLTDD